MKYIYNLFCIFSSIFVLSSCLESNLEDLPEYEDANVTTVSAISYRYLSEEKSPASGEFIVEEVNLEYTTEINTEKGEVKINVTTPKNFPEKELDNLSKNNLVVIVSISTAARLEPLDNSPKLGIPGDWSKPNYYLISSASGNKKTWKLEVVSLTK